MFGQKNKLLKPPTRPFTQKEIEAEESNHGCIKKNFLTFANRVKKYPFNVSAQIQFVSFNGGVYLTDRDILNTDSFPRINNSNLFAKLSQVKTLTFSEVDKLSDIFFNYGYKGPTFAIQDASCYVPRNGILFLDKHNKVVDFIEICFQCQKISASSKNISMGEMCEQKLDMIFQFFKKVGIEYGITKGVNPSE